MIQKFCRRIIILMNLSPMLSSDDEEQVVSVVRLFKVKNTAPLPVSYTFQKWTTLMISVM